VKNGFPVAGIRITAPFRSLKPVFEQWQKLSSSPEWLSVGDAPWWYGERASLSSFAGAVWRSNGWAFEEFGSQKRTIHKSKAGWTSGRVDIAFRVGRKYFLAEAKQYWPRLSNDRIDVTLDGVSKILAEACNDVRKISEPGYIRMGMAFIVPSIHKSKKEHLAKGISDLMEGLLNHKDTTVAWTFPEAAQKIKADKPYHERIYPGVILIIRKVGR
jgi:hypothetical protein